MSANANSALPQEDQLAMVRRQLEYTRTQRNKSMDEVATLSVALESSHSRETAAAAELQGVRAKLSETQRLVTESTALNNQYQNEIDQLRSKLDETTKQAQRVGKKRKAAENK